MLAAPNISIVDSTAAHVSALRKCMREEDAIMAVRLGMDPSKALWRAYKYSIYRKTAFVDGRIAAMWGLSGVLLGEVGRPWLLTSEVAGEYPIRVAFRYRQELNDMLKLFPVLEDWADINHTKSLRMLKLMGFELEEPRPKGERGALFIRAIKRA